MASMLPSPRDINAEAIAHALSLSRGDQEGLADFLTDYFGSAEPEELGKHMNKYTIFIVFLETCYSLTHRSVIQ